MPFILVECVVGYGVVASFMTTGGAHGETDSSIPGFIIPHVRKNDERAFRVGVQVQQGGSRYTRNIHEMTWSR